MRAQDISIEREVASRGHFYNLGDLIDKSRDLHKTAVIDLGGETAPREFSFDAMDRMANGVARGLLARAWCSAIHCDDLTVLLPCPWLISATPGPRVLRVFLTTGRSPRCSRRQ